MLINATAVFQDDLDVRGLGLDPKTNIEVYQSTQQQFSMENDLEPQFALTTEV